MAWVKLIGIIKRKISLLRDLFLPVGSGAFRKDVVALMGLDTDKTADTWAAPDTHTKAYWFEDLLKPCAESLRSGRHHLVAAFLQLDSEFDPAIWEEKSLIEQIHKWFSYRDKQAGHQRTCPGISVAKLVQPLAGNPDPTI